MARRGGRPSLGGNAPDARDFTGGRAPRELPATFTRLPARRRATPPRSTTRRPRTRALTRLIARRAPAPAAARPLAARPPPPPSPARAPRAAGPPVAGAGGQDQQGLGLPLGRQPHLDSLPQLGRGGRAGGGVVGPGQQPEQPPGWHVAQGD